MTNLFSAEGFLFKICDTAGKLIIASVLWIIGCIPILTIGTSTAALYYAVVKSVRGEESYVHTEFFRAYKRNLKNGIISMILLLPIAYLAYGWVQIWLGQGEANSVWMLCSGIFLLGVGMAYCYIYPVMSRFSFSFIKILRMSFSMGLQKIHLTAALLVGLLLLIFAQFTLLPYLCILIVPGAWAYGSSYLVEMAIKPYMPEPATEEERKWYDDLYRPRKRN